MLAVGIGVLAASIVIGVVAIAALALISPGTRSAGKRVRVAMALSEEDEGVAQRARPDHAGGAVEPAPRWFLTMAVIAGAGLLLGMLMVMIASVV